MRLERFRFIGEMPNSPFVWFLGIAWSALSIISTLSFLFPKMGNHVPRWPWHIWVIGFLVVALVAVFEGAYRQAGILWNLTDQTQLDIVSAQNAAALSALPTFRTDLTIVLLSIRRGIAFGSDENLFLNLRIISKTNIGVFNISALFRDDQQTLKSPDPIFDLSDWRHIVPVDNPHYPYKSHEDTSLNELNLWDDIRKKQLQAGVQREGWVGFVIPQQRPRLVEHLSWVKLTVDLGTGCQTFVFRPPWPEVEVTIIDVDFRR